MCFPRVFYLVRLPSFAAMTRCIPHRPSKRSRSTGGSKINSVKVRANRKSNYQLFLKKEFGSIIPFLFLFLCKYSRQFMFYRNDNLPPSCFVKRKTILSLMCVGVPKRGSRGGTNGRGRCSTPFSPKRVGRFFGKILRSNLFRGARFVSGGRYGSCQDGVFRSRCR